MSSDEAVEERGAGTASGIMAIEGVCESSKQNCLRYLSDSTPAQQRWSPVAHVSSGLGDEQVLISAKWHFPTPPESDTDVPMHPSLKHTSVEPANSKPAGTSSSSETDKGPTRDRSETVQAENPATTPSIKNDLGSRLTLEGAKADTPITTQSKIVTFLTDLQESEEHVKSRQAQSINNSSCDNEAASDIDNETEIHSPTIDRDKDNGAMSQRFMVINTNKRKRSSLDCGDHRYWPAEFQFPAPAAGIVFDPDGMSHEKHLKRTTKDELPQLRSTTRCLRARSLPSKQDAALNTGNVIMNAPERLAQPAIVPAKTRVRYKRVETPLFDFSWQEVRPGVQRAFSPNVPTSLDESNHPPKLDSGTDKGAVEGEGDTIEVATPRSDVDHESEADVHSPRGRVTRIEALREAAALVRHRMLTRRKRPRVSFDESAAHNTLAQWKGVEVEDLNTGCSPEFLKRRKHFGTK